MTTAIDHQNLEYIYHAQDWRTVRDCLLGERHIHERGDAYLPRLSVRKDARALARYEAYKARGRFLQITARTLAGWTGAIFRKQPQIEVPASMEPVRSDADLCGSTMAAFARSVVEEVLTTGRAGALVDHQKKAGGRPYVVLFRAEEVIDWSYLVDDGVRKLARVVLERRSLSPAVSLLGTESCDERRELLLQDGVYTVTVWRRETSKGRAGEWQPAETSTPTVRGKTLDFIPFVFFGPTDRPGVEVQQGPLLSIARLNVHHYVRMADLGNILHAAAQPTPYVTGAKLSAKGEGIEYGSGVFLEIDNPGAKLGMLEPTGAGIEAIERDAKEIKSEAAALGASYLTPPKREAETAEAVELKNSDASSPLAALVDAVSTRMTLVLEYLAMWSGVDPASIAFLLNKDFDKTSLTPDQIRVLSEMLIEGSITPEVFAKKLHDAEFLPADKRPEEFQQEIEANMDRNRADAQEAAQLAARSNTREASNDATNNAQEGNNGQAASS